ncbi:MAG: RluA family pseudouridine synthase [Candidatus Omnitrophica bacterium]|nr:RluA family pseudouridine synthase [Candidatus Omnitrophota bacterium]MCK5287903.1 RluA family pseudouridine synthase [Candidatus Omnitrophota bacterium]
MNKPFEVVFNDEYLIVVNKIAKILVQPTTNEKKNTLTTLLAKHLGAKVFPCHRLDKETTGLLVYAKNSQIQTDIMEQFQRGSVFKRYIAFIKGRLKDKKGLLEDYILDKDGVKFGEKEKEAKTAYKVLKLFEYFSVLELKPYTGRTNQLRIQLAKIGHPILGEDKYAFRRDFEIRFKRIALHAFYLSFIHPVSKDVVELKIPWATDMENFLYRFN